jgi:hypothetical protein
MSPLILPLLQDGAGYICVDKKMEAKYRIGSGYPNPEQILEWWGGEKHRELVKSIKPKADCINNRCTGCEYNRQMEEVVINDSMFLSFP